MILVVLATIGVVVYKKWLAMRKERLSEHNARDDEADRKKREKEEEKQKLLEEK